LAFGFSTAVAIYLLSFSPGGILSPGIAETFLAVFSFLVLFPTIRNLDKIRDDFFLTLQNANSQTPSTRLGHFLLGTTPVIISVGTFSAGAFGLFERYDLEMFILGTWVPLILSFIIYKNKHVRFVLQICLVALTLVSLLLYMLTSNI
jgi:hypothetical protein